MIWPRDPQGHYLANDPAWPLSDTLWAFKMRLPPDAKLGTLLQHLGEEDKVQGAVVPPIFQNSLFVFDDFESFQRAWTETPEGPPAHYSRVGNPSLAVVERKLAALERTEAAKVMNSGMAAISAVVLSCVEAGAHIVSIENCYRPARHLFSDYLPRFGVSTTYVDGTLADDLIDTLTPQTRLVYLESPSTGVFKLQDLAAIARACREKNVTTVCDNSYASPVFQNPAEFGIDIVVHSASKYLGGHSDIVAGAICATRARMDRMVAPAGEIPLLGGVLPPFQAWLLTRGMRTLELRMHRHQQTANEVAAWLERQPQVERVHHVGLPSYPQRELFQKQMHGASGLLSFEPRAKDMERVFRFVNALRLFQIGVSWGGFESLVMIMAPRPDAECLVRLSCGLEDPSDLIADLAQALDTL